MSAAEPVISATKQLDSDVSISLKLVLDTLTCASANGAVSTNGAQTFTRPSGNGSYTTAANETPLDDTFQDTRVALSGNWDMPLTRFDRLALGGNVSKEFDYTSLGVSSLYSHDLQGRNTTLSAGLSVASDIIEPIGNTPIAFGVMQPAGESANKNSLFLVNYSFSQVDAYLTDPFKVISIVDPVTGIPVVEDAATNLSRVVFENRPDSRTKHSIFTQYKNYLSGDVLDVSYWYMFDDWEINSHTIDYKYRWNVSDTAFWRPPLRYYQQSEAKFYQPFFLTGEAPAAGTNTSFAIADYRLGELTTYTVGLEYGRVYKDHGWSMAVEYYLQSPSESGNKVGELNNQELSADVDALMVRLTLSFLVGQALFDIFFAHA